MNLKNDIDLAFKKAMQEKDKEGLSVLRMLKASLKNKAIETKKQVLEDADILTVLKSEIKKRRDSIESFLENDRKEQAEKEKKELVVLQRFMPEQIGENEIIQTVEKVIKELPEEEQGNFGKVMKAVMAEIGQKADGGLVAATVKKLLSE